MFESESFWELVEQIMEMIACETEYPVLIYDTNGAVILAADKARVGDLHPGAQEVMRGKVAASAVTPEEAAQNPLIREGCICPIYMEGQIVAGLGITAEHAIAKPVAKLSAKMIEAWIEKHKYQIRLERSEKKYRDIFNHSLHGIYQVTLEGRFLAANTAMAAILGYPDPNALMTTITHIGKQLYAIPEDLTAFLEAIQKDGQVTGFETRLRHRDGGIIDVRINARLKTDSSTHTVFIEGLLEDVTDRKKAEADLRKAAEKFSKTFNNAPVWVVLSSLESGRYIEVNDAFLNTTGYKREEVIGRTSLELDTWLDPSEREKIMHIINTGGVCRDVEVKRRLKSGQVLTMFFSADVITISGESCLLSVSQDMTAIKNVEEELKRNVNFTKALLNAVPTPVFYKDRNGLYQGCNQAFSEVMGVTPDDIRGKSVHQLWPGEHADVYHRNDLALMENPEHQAYEFKIKDKHGNTR
ncbi:MAG: PAS domain S-box protein [Desulfobacteraceae bacterium]